MSTQADMKARIALELRRDDLTADIANAIGSALIHYQYDRFRTFNNSSLQAFPATDSEMNNPWMNDAEPLIRNHAKGLLYAGIMKEPTSAKLHFDLATQIEGKLKTSITFQTELASYVAGTRGMMKARIANEIERGDMPTQISDAIGTAISFYQNERWYFNESRENTLSTNANQFKYTLADAAWIGNLIKLDWMMVYIGGLPYRLHDLQPVEQEWSHLQAPATDPVGQPYRFTFYEQAIFIYPSPDQTYTIRAGGQFITAAPPDDVTVSVWTNDLEDVIRSRAKYELYMHCDSIRDPMKATAMKQQADDAFNEWKKHSQDLDKDGDFDVHPWGY